MKKRLIEKHLQALAEGNWERFAETLADEVIYIEHPTLQRNEGMKEMISVIQRWKQAFPDLKASIKEMIALDRKVVVQLEWEGTHQGTLSSPALEVPATQRQGVLAAVEIFTIKKGKIVEAEHYFDLMTMLLQLGVVPHFEITAQAQPAVH